MSSLRTPFLRLVFTWSCAGCLLAAGILPVAAEPVQTRFVEAELISEVQAIRPGEPFWVGLRLAMKPGWHTYWENPGDSGLATELAWTLPDGFHAGELVWPYPSRFEHAPYVSYGYVDEIVLLARVEPPSSLEPGADVSLMARADWTVCREDLCTPGGADLQLDLAVAGDGPKPNTLWTQHFAAARGHLPMQVEGWTAEATVEGQALELVLTSDSDHEPGEISVFERQPNVVDHAKPVEITRNGKTVRISLATARPAAKLPTELDLVLVAESGWRADGTVKAMTLSVPVRKP